MYIECSYLCHVMQCLYVYDEVVHLSVKHCYLGLTEGEGLVHVRGADHGVLPLPQDSVTGHLHKQRAPASPQIKVGFRYCYFLGETFMYEW